MFHPLRRPELVTFAFEGTLTQVGAPLDGNWNVGQRFSGSYTFDSNAQSEPVVGFPGVTSVTYLRAPQALQATIGTYQLTDGPPAPNGGLGSIGVANNDSVVMDEYAVSIVADGSPTPVTGYTPLQFNLALIDPAGTALNSLSLPLTPPNLSAFQQHTVNFQFFQFVNGNTTFANAVGDLNSLTVVPLPATLWLFGLGLMSLIAWNQLTSKIPKLWWFWKIL